MRRGPVPAAGIALMLVVAAACSGGATTAAPPANAAAPAAGSSTTAVPAAAASCGDPTASLRPQTPMPSPEQMPAGSYMQKIHDRGRLIVGVDQTTLLFGSLNPLTNKIEGFDIDVLKEVAKAIFGPDVETHIDYRAITSAQRIPFIQAGTVDIVGRTMTINCDRIKQVSFSTVYYQAGQKVLIRSDSAAKGIQDLAGQKVCAVTGSTSLDNIRRAASHPSAFAVDDWTDCLVALQRNQVNAISTDDSILAGLAAQDPYTKVVGASISPQPYGLAINKEHREFVRFVNGVLQRMRADGTWAALYNKWLAAHLGPVPAPPPATYSD